MLDTVLSTSSRLFHAIPFTSATWFVVVLLGFFVYLFTKAAKSKTSPIVWEHLIIDSDNNRASPYKVGYLIGLVVGTWVIITFADGGKLTYDIFGLYLTYLLGGAGWNSLSKKPTATAPASGTFDDNDTLESGKPTQ